uniref:C-reactive protein-like n=1 Tax=Doryrhamphus excisus TaxID=161450 RepID=UPI0025ADD966|nr:C-reactive protein-like [Doryrhamphus excisus]
MNMDGSRLYAIMVMAALMLMEASGEQILAAWTTASPTTNLDGKMVTLSSRGGGVSFYPPYFSLPPTDPTAADAKEEYMTTAYPNSANPNSASPVSASYDWTTQPPIGGVTVCLRYLLDLRWSSPFIFTLSPSGQSAMKLGVHFDGQFELRWNRPEYQSVYLTPSIRIWPDIPPDIWSRVCITMDTLKSVVQLFSGGNMSVRKMIPFKYVWSGEPVVTMSGLEGQVTDVQVWDYLLPYNDIFNYMSITRYRWPPGSVLTWSNIRYSMTGRTLLEDTYELRAKKTTRKKTHGRQLQANRRTSKNHRRAQLTSNQ